MSPSNSSESRPSGQSPATIPERIELDTQSSQVSKGSSTSGVSGVACLPARTIWLVDARLS